MSGDPHLLFFGAAEVEAAVDGSLPNRPPLKCSCTNEHKPVEVNGEMWIFTDPACRVHVRPLVPCAQPLGEEPILGDWKYREREREGYHQKAKAKRGERL